MDESHSIPTLMVLLPLPKSIFTMREDPNLDRRGMLFLICDETKQLVECGPKGKGYYLNTSLPWVKEALPVLKVGLMLLQVGLSASGVPFISLGWVE